MIRVRPPRAAAAPSWSAGLFVVVALAHVEGILDVDDRCAARLHPALDARAPRGPQGVAGRRVTGVTVVTDVTDERQPRRARLRGAPTRRQGTILRSLHALHAFHALQGTILRSLHVSYVLHAFHA